MRALENRTLDSKIEMDIIEALDEIKSLNARNATITSDTLLEHHKRTYEHMQKTLEQEDEETVQNVVFKNSNKFIKRIEDEDEQQPTKVAKSSAPVTDFIKVLPLPDTKKLSKPKPIAAIKVVPVKAKKEQTPSLVDY